ncbi:nuclear transport factor 2 family protein [Streptomyces inhibens]|uniref:nuclear transport factor 2 family protein n=1 Tax=Streptomyces inhibens TaxID=2293571 RepID=UPI00402A8E12
MTAQQSREIVQRAWQACATCDAERISAFFDEDAQWLAPAGNATAAALDVTNHMVGRKGIVRFLTIDFPRLFAKDVAVTFRGFHADGDVSSWKRPWRRRCPTGRATPMTTDFCFVFELHNGLIYRVREYMDTARGARMVFANQGGDPA